MIIRQNISEYFVKVQASEDPALTAEAEDFINFSKQQNKFCLSLNYNGANS